MTESNAPLDRRTVRYVLGGRVFTTTAAAELEARRILNDAALDPPLAGNDAAFVADLFSLHDEYEAKLAGHEPVAYHVRRHPTYPNRNFMVAPTDGEAVHFSYRHALKPMPRGRWFGIAARDLVRAQILAHRDAYFARHAGPDGIAPCERTGRRSRPRTPTCTTRRRRSPRSCGSSSRCGRSRIAVPGVARPVTPSVLAPRLA